MAESRSKLRYGSVSKPLNLTIRETATRFPGFYGFCVNCHEEMWADTQHRPRNGGICLMCDTLRSTGVTVLTSYSFALGDPESVDCRCCGVFLDPSKRPAFGYCSTCFHVRTVPVASLKKERLPRCAGCRNVRDREREWLRGSA